MKIISRQKRKRDITHKNIMHSAKYLFESKGIGNVKIEEITNHADVSRSTFFSHFASLEALSTEIADVAIDEILQSYKNNSKKGIEGIIALMNKLIDDTCPYPNLTVELFMEGILKSDGKSSFKDFQKVIMQELANAGINHKDYSHEELVGLIMGSYYGLIFQKLIIGESFDNPKEIKNTTQKFIFNMIGGTNNE